MRITVYIPDETEQWIRNRAATEFRSVSNLVQALIERERRKEQELVAAEKE